MYSTVLTISVWQRINELDKWLFVKLNHNFANPVFDAVLPFFRDSYFWAPFYIFILAFMMLNYGKKGLWWSLAFICTVSLTDSIGTYIFKIHVQRLRPCQDPAFFQNVRLVVHQCAGGYSFLSNHAANHFGLATFMVFTFKDVFKRWIYLLYLWAVVIAFAQVYVGVHYPGDVAGGMVLGTLIGLFTAWMSNRYVGSFRREFQMK